MSGWLLFFVFIALIGRPKVKAATNFGAVIGVLITVVWGAINLGLIAAALRTGGYL